MDYSNQSPIKVNRLNADSSWIFNLDGIRLLVDPWLEGKSIVGHSLFYSATHSEPVLPVNQLPHYDALLITHPFGDHCHLPTLQQLAKDKPVIAPALAARTLRKIGFTEVHALANSLRQNTPFYFKGLEIYYYRADKKMDATHNSFLISSPASNSKLLLCPHCTWFDDRSKYAAIFAGPIDLLVTCFSYYGLPMIFGGKANMGMADALKLVRQISPAAILSTHDEQKIEGGLVALFAKFIPPENLLDALSTAQIKTQFLSPPVGVETDIPIHQHKTMV